MQIKGGRKNIQHPHALWFHIVSKAHLFDTPTSWLPSFFPSVLLLPEIRTLHTLFRTLTEKFSIQHKPKPNLLTWLHSPDIQCYWHLKRNLFCPKVTDKKQYQVSMCHCTWDAGTSNANSRTRTLAFSIRSASLALVVQRTLRTTT